MTLRKLAMVCYMVGAALFFVGTVFNWMAGE